MVAHTPPQHLEEGKRQYDALLGQARLFVDLQTSGATPMSVWDAYREAGYKGAKPTAASKMATVYRQAIEYRKWVLTSRLDDERDAQLERLRRYARGSYRKIYPKSLSLTEKEWRELADEDKDLISELTIEEVTEGRGEAKTYVRKVKLKIEPRLAAEGMLAKLGGWFAPEKEDPEALAILGKLSAFAAAELARRRTSTEGDEE